MIPQDLLTVFTIAGLGFTTGYCYVKWRQCYLKYREVKADAARALHNYQQHHQTMLGIKVALQKQLEASETKWGEAITQIEYKDKEMALFLGKYKQLEKEKIGITELLADTNKKFIELERAYNLLNPTNDPHALPM